MLVTLLALVVVLGVLILVHELGHFMAAKAVDIEVPRFSIGLGPKMFGFKRGETEYVVSWLPLGGYVKMAGMADEAATAPLEGGVTVDRSPSPRDFEAKPLWARTFVILAGVLMNWLFAVGAFTAIAFQQGVIEPRIIDVIAESPAEAAGLAEGDLFVAVDGRRVSDPNQVTMAIEARPGEEISVTVERDGERLDLDATPEPVRLYSELAKDTITVGRIGVSLGGEENHRDVGAVAALGQGFGQTGYWTATIVRFVKQLITGETSLREVGGPVMIGQLSGRAARAGIWSLILLMAIISVNLAVLNLLPIPVLDGGHLVFLLVEAVRGKALSIEQRIRWTTAGMVVVVGLMIWAIGNDLLRLFGI